MTKLAAEISGVESKSHSMSDPGTGAPASGKTLWLLFGLSLVVRLVFLLISDNEDGDSFVRTLLSRRVVDDGTLLPTEVWLPIHFWILAVPYGLGLESQFWPRLLTAFAGAGTIPFTYLIVRRLNGEKLALAASLLVVLSPLHIRFSIVTVSEAFVVLSVAMGLWGFLEFIESGRRWPLILGALGLNLACGHRMEPWLLLPVFPVVGLFPAWFLGRSLASAARNRAFLFTGLSSLFVVGWTTFSWAAYGDPLHIATLNSGRVAADAIYVASQGWYTVAFWPVVLIAGLGPVGVLLGLFGAGKCLGRGHCRLFSLLFFGLLAIYYVQNARIAMITDARYSVILLWLLVLSVGAGLKMSRIPVKWPVWILALVAWPVMVWVAAEANLGILSSKMRSITPRPRIEAVVRTANAWFQEQPPVASIVLGPGFDRYGPWLSLLDDWYPRTQIKVLKTRQVLTEHIDRHSSGCLALDPNQPEVESLGLGEILAPEILQTAKSYGRYRIYCWERGPTRSAVPRGG